jgi:hypothetical protein
MATMNLKLPAAVNGANVMTEVPLALPATIPLPRHSTLRLEIVARLMAKEEMTTLDNNINNNNNNKEATELLPGPTTALLPLGMSHVWTKSQSLERKKCALRCARHV